MNEFKELIRSATRPIVTVMLVFTVMWIAIEGLEMPIWLVSMASLVLGYWFGERKATK